MSLTPFQQKQSSEDWQDGVRWENRFKKIEREIEDLRRLSWWIVIGYVGGIVLLTTILLFHH